MALSFHAKAHVLPDSINASFALLINGLIALFLQNDSFVSICQFSGFWKCEFQILIGFEGIYLNCAAQSKHHLPYLPDSKEGKVCGLIVRPLTVLHLETLVCFPLVNIFTFLIHVLCLATKSDLRPCGLLERSEYIMVPG